MSRPRTKPLRGAVAALVALALVAPPLPATWSIVAVDAATGEVAVASATCLAEDDLEVFVPVVYVGRGAGASQANVDLLARNKKIMFAGFGDGLSPAEILDRLIEDGPNGLSTRQFGIAAFSGPARTFTGGRDGAAALGRAGRVGSITYAIQGNVLAGNEVVLACRDAFTAAGGDLGQRVMAAMEAARSFGGDGRCSCDLASPTSCGSPPDGFEKSAHVGFVIVARTGDKNGRCTAPTGCATGRYYLNLEFLGAVEDEDPVLALRAQYDAWRAERTGRPDHVLSTVEVAADSLPADGRTRTTVTVRLRDVDGVPLDHGGAAVGVSVSAAGDVLSAGAVTDHGDGSYSFPVVAGLEPGTAELRIVADDGVDRALLFPFPRVRVDALVPLHCGKDRVDVRAAAAVPLVINEPSAAGAPYVLLASASGTSPGLRFAGAHLPLNPDRLFGLSHGFAGGPNLPGTVGVLDGDGHAEAALLTPVPWSAALLGLRVDWAAVLFSRPPRATNAAGFEVLLP